MKHYTNKKYNTIARYAILVLSVNVLIVVAIFKFGTILDILSEVTAVLMPIIWGLVIAFLTNPVMVHIDNFLKKRIIKNPKRKNITRAISILVSSLVFLGIVAGIIAVIVPELIKSFNEIVDNFSSFVTVVQKWLNRMLKNYPQVQDFITNKLIEFGTDLTKIQPMLENILSGAWGFVTFIKNFLLGFIVSIYLLYSKDILLAQTKKIIFAVFKRNSAEKIMSVGSQANSIFSGFLNGKIIDSLIIGMLCFIGLTILDMPYNILISVIVGVTNIIPYFGPFIGAIPSAVLILIIEPKKVFWFVLFILVLQQFDGNILGPKILGGSTGLPAIWVMISLLIGGGLFGFVGMILAVPTFALIYSFTRDNVETRLKKKKMPVSTAYYIENADKLYSESKEKKAPLTVEELSRISIPSAEEVNEACDGEAAE
ncbi:MAG: AI-2E family transporter [Oscillospiraceae bacterium]